MKIHQRNARSLEAPNVRNDTVTLRPKSAHKHGHRKHKYSDSEDHVDKLSIVERKKLKYHKFLEKIFAKEALKRDMKVKRVLNETSALLNVTSNSLVSNVSSDMQLARNRRSSINVDSAACINSEFTMLDIGCNSQESMEFHSSCDNKEFITGNYRYLIFVCLMYI